jgi:hypothetical protein
MDFNEDDFSEEADNEFESRHEKLKKFPLYIKSMEILDTVDAICESMVKKDNDVYSSILRESAMMIPPKIAGAFGSGSWLICMQNAAIIRYHAEYLLTATSGLKHFTKTDKKYIQVMRDDLLEFRDLFAKWVSTFDELEDDDFDDQWGLFNRKK